jgi:hypothetical protein
MCLICFVSAAGVAGSSANVLLFETRPVHPPCFLPAGFHAGKVVMLLLILPVGITIHILIGSISVISWSLIKLVLRYPGPSFRDKVIWWAAGVECVSGATYGYKAAWLLLGILELIGRGQQ